MTTAPTPLAISLTGPQALQIRRELLDTKLYGARGVACLAVSSRRPFLIWSGYT